MTRAKTQGGGKRAGTQSDKRKGKLPRAETFERAVDTAFDALSDDNLPPIPKKPKPKQDPSVKTEPIEPVDLEEPDAQAAFDAVAALEIEIDDAPAPAPAPAKQAVPATVPATPSGKLPAVPQPAPASPSVKISVPQPVRHPTGSVPTEFAQRVEPSSPVSRDPRAALAALAARVGPPTASPQAPRAPAPEPAPPPQRKIGRTRPPPPPGAKATDDEVPGNRPLGATAAEAAFDAIEQLDESGLRVDEAATVPDKGRRDDVAHVHDPARRDTPSPRKPGDAFPRDAGRDVVPGDASRESPRPGRDFTQRDESARPYSVDVDELGEEFDGAHASIEAPDEARGEYGHDGEPESDLEIEVRRGPSPARSPARPRVDYPEGTERPATPFPVHARSISVGETQAEDLVVDMEDVPKLRALAIAIHDGAPHVAPAQQAIVAAGHAVALGANGRAGIERVAAAMRDGRVDALLVGIPGGEPLIELAHELSPRPIVIAASTCPSAEAVKRALAAGADLATTRPHDLERLAPVLLAAARLAGERVALPGPSPARSPARRPVDFWEGPESDYGIPDPDDDDFDEGGGFASTEEFASAFDVELARARKFAYPIAVALFASELPKDPPPGVRGILRARAGIALLAGLRDIDIATELDQDRFLVVLPYTAVDAAAEVARRVVAQVAASAPLTVAGRSFAPRVTGAVAGAQPGQPLAFARLMRAAEQALDRARKSGTDLAVES